MAQKGHVARMSLCADLGETNNLQAVENYMAKPGVSHADLWLDDISIDIAHQDAEIAASLSVEVYRSLKRLLHEEGLELNMGKTKFVVNNAKSCKALRAMAELVKDLGLDSAGAKRRRVTTAMKRFRICLSRHSKLKSLKLSRRLRTRVFNSPPLLQACMVTRVKGLRPNA